MLRTGTTSSDKKSSDKKKDEECLLLTTGLEQTLAIEQEADRIVEEAKLDLL